MKMKKNLDYFNHSENEAMYKNIQQLE